MDIKIGQVAPLIDYSMLSTNNESVTLRNSVKENGIIVIFSCNTCPFVVGFSDSTFPGWENQYNSIFPLIMLYVYQDNDLRLGLNFYV
jgi:hypothetical protein